MELFGPEVRRSVCLIDSSVTLRAVLPVDSGAVVASMSFSSANKE